MAEYGEITMIVHLTGVWRVRAYAWFLTRAVRWRIMDVFTATATLHRYIKRHVRILPNGH
jgi:hypothetical protein